VLIHSFETVITTGGNKTYHIHSTSITVITMEIYQNL